MPTVKEWSQACHGKALLNSIWIKPTHRTWRITKPQKFPAPLQLQYLVMLPDFTPPPPPSSGPTEDMLRGVHVEDPTGGSPAEDVLIRGTQGSDDVIEAGQGNDQVYSGSGDRRSKVALVRIFCTVTEVTILSKVVQVTTNLQVARGDDTLKGGQRQRCPSRRIR